MNTPADELLSICRHLIDPDAQPLDIHPGHDSTVTVRAASRAGEVIIKRHRELDRHHQEVHAYRHWTPVLGHRAPRLLAASEDPAVIIVTAVPGRPLAEAVLDIEQEREAHRQAGHLLRLFHGAAPPEVESDMTTWLARRGEQWLALAGDVLPERRRTEIHAHLRALADLGPIATHPCHLDYTPRNVLISTHGDIALIDFEHARYDLAARDLVRLAMRTWPSRPDLEEAFLSEYGALSPLDRQVIEHCSYLDVLTSAVRGAGHALPVARP